MGPEVLPVAQRSGFVRACLPSADKTQYSLIVTFCQPDCFQEVGWVESVLSEKMPVSAAAVHNVMAKSSLEEAGCLLDDPREPRNSCKSCTLWRQLIGSNFVQAAGTLLFEDEIVATDRDNEKIGVPIRFSRRDEILDVIIDVDRTQPNRSEEPCLFRRKIGCIPPFPVAVKSCCLIVNGAQARGPNIGLHDAIPNRVAAILQYVCRTCFRLRATMPKKDNDVRAFRTQCPLNRQQALRRRS